MRAGFKLAMMYGESEPRELGGLGSTGGTLLDLLPGALGGALALVSLQH